MSAPDLEPSCGSEHCITCGDDGVPMTVLALDADRGLALCSDEAAKHHTVETALVEPVAPGDRLLVHAGTAIASLTGAARHEVRRRVPRRRAGSGRGRRDPLARRAGPALQVHGGVRRPHALHLQVRRRRSAAGQRRARARPRLSGLRHPDGARRRRHRARPRGGRDLHLLRRHDAGAGVQRQPARGQGGRRRHPHGLFAARRAADRQAEPRSRGRVLRHRVRDHGALDRADAEARPRRGDRQLLLHVHPCDDRAAAAGAARVAGPAPRRVHRAGARLHGGRRAAFRVHPGRLRQAGGDRRLRAARHAPGHRDDPPPARGTGAARSRTSTSASFPTRAICARSR